jgi:hypothetical protein
MPISLTGLITGSYKSPVVTPTAVVVGPSDTYILNGSGTAGAMGQVTTQGIVTLPGLAETGFPTGGSLTLTNSGGSVTLDLTAPVQPVVASASHILDYVISQATGIYAGDTDSGTIGIELIPGTGVSSIGSGGFTLTIS